MMVFLAKADNFLFERLKLQLIFNLLVQDFQKSNSTDQNYKFVMSYKNIDLETILVLIISFVTLFFIIKLFMETFTLHSIHISYFSFVCFSLSFKLVSFT